MLFFGDKSVLLKYYPYYPVAFGRIRLASHERDQTREAKRKVLSSKRLNESIPKSVSLVASR